MQPDWLVAQMLEADENSDSADLFLDKVFNSPPDQARHPLDQKRWTRKQFGWNTWESQKLANNTYLTRRPGSGDYESQFIYAVRLHATDILTCWPDGTVSVSSGGWKTVTTKARINEFLPKCLPHANQRIPSVYQKQREWYWWAGWEPVDVDDVRRQRIRPIIVGEFDDGDWFSPDGALHKARGQVEESVADSSDVESAACNYIEQEVGRYDWKANWEHHRSQPDLRAKLQAWLQHYDYQLSADAVVEFIDGTMMQAEGRWR
mgnify:CR=1 FL=1